jgi:hypothetical protein
MEYDWIIEQPIDLEYKQYLVLDYVKKVEEKLDRFELYPSFQELTIHYSSMSRVLSDGQFITLKRIPEDIDDEILLTDLVYNTIRTKSDEESNEILKIAEFASDKFKNLFMVSKTLWSLINDSISIKQVINEESIKGDKRADGYIKFDYMGELYMYQFIVKRLTEKSLENKCYYKKIYQGEHKETQSIINEFSLFYKNSELFDDCENWSEEKREEAKLSSPIFEVLISQNFPLEGCLLPLIRRKVMGYLFQTIKLEELKND